MSSILLAKTFFVFLWYLVHIRGHNFSACSMTQSSELRDMMTKPAIFFFLRCCFKTSGFYFTQAKYAFFIGLHTMLSPLLNFQLSFFWVNVELLLFTKYLLILYDIEFWLNNDTRLELQDRHFGLVLLSSWCLCWMFNSNNLLCSGVVHSLFELSPMPASIITWFI